MLEQRAFHSAVVVLLITGACPSCGGRLAPDGASQEAGAVATAGAAGQASPVSSSCPVSLPSGGTPCSNEGLACEYGTSADPQCDSIAICGQGAWAVVPASSCAPPAPQSICNAALGPPDSTMTMQCQSAGSVCEASLDGAYARCACVPTGEGLAYQCLLSSTDAACVYPRPRLGSGCPTEGVVCDYGACFALPGGARLRCVSGAWELDQSTRCH